MIFFFSNGTKEFSIILILILSLSLSFACSMIVCVFFFTTPPTRAYRNEKQTQSSNKICGTIIYSHKIEFNIVSLKQRSEDLREKRREDMKNILDVLFLLFSGTENRTKAIFNLCRLHSISTLSS